MARSRQPFSFFQRHKIVELVRDALNIGANFAQMVADFFNRFTTATKSSISEATRTAMQTLNAADRFNLLGPSGLLQDQNIPAIAEDIANYRYTVRIDYSYDNERREGYYYATINSSTSLSRSELEAEAAVIFDNNIRGIGSRPGGAPQDAEIIDVVADTIFRRA